jgi:sulfatase modifying factor 1
MRDEHTHFSTSVFLSVCLSVCLIGVARGDVITHGATTIDMAFVDVGSPGNAADTTGYGAVDYNYRIGTYEVTAGQYTAFLNAVASTDTYNLYNPSMDSDPLGCQITRSGSSGSYTYSVAADYADRPVNFVSWEDAARFSNWLTTGDTETGIYDTTTWAAVTHATAASSLDVGTAYFIPTLDEWYKAAYYDPTTEDYFMYPTSSDTVPGYVNDAGNLSGGGAFSEGGVDPGNYATYNGDGGTAGIGADYYRTKVGEWENSASPFDTFDQGGSVWEWNETLFDFDERGVRGGAFNSGIGYEGLQATLNNADPPSGYEISGIGFRVASVIPEPGSLGLLIVALAGLVARRKRG